MTLTGLVAAKEIKVTSMGKVRLVTVKPEVFPEEFGGLDGLGAPSGKVLCYLREDSPNVFMGSRIQIQGELSCFERATNPGEFSQADYYRILKTDFKLYEARILTAGSSYSPYREGLYQIRVFCGQMLDRYFSAENASVLRTMLLGESGQTDREIKELYRRSGILHILAISGLHISLLGMGLYRILRKWYLPLQIAAPAVIAVMYSYGVMTNQSASAVRAVMMFAIHMAAIFLGRTYDSLTALACAAILILLDQPLYLQHSGFLFSFLAVAAIGLLIPVMNDGLPVKTPWRKKSLEAFLAGICISAVTLPIYSLFYYQFPVPSLFLNLLIIPLTGILMLSGIMTMAAGAFWVPAGKVTSIAAAWILTIYEFLCRWSNQLPFSNLIMGKSQTWQIFLYGMILVFLVLFGKKFSWGIRYLMLSAGILVLVCRIPFGLTVAFLDVGQGDCMYIRSPSGEHFLIDGGSADRRRVGEYQIIPYLKSQGVSRLDAVFITHPDQDHCSALPELLAGMGEGGISIGALVLPDIAERGKKEAYHGLEEMAKEAGVVVQYMSRGQTWKKKEMMLQCLHPDSGSLLQEGNEYSTVLLLRYGAFSALFTGDMEGMGEEEWNRYGGDIGGETGITVLKVAHHGSRNATGEEFLEKVSPAYAVISAGKGNVYGHPHAELLERLQGMDTEVYITSESGAVTVHTDGEKMKIESFCKDRIEE